MNLALCFTVCLLTYYVSCPPAMAFQLNECVKAKMKRKEAGEQEKLLAKIPKLCSHFQVAYEHLRLNRLHRVQLPI